MANNLNADARKWLLKSSRSLRILQPLEKEKRLKTFGTQAPMRQTIYCICDKFDAIGSILNAPQISRPRTVCAEDHNNLLLKHFFQSQKV